MPRISKSSIDEVRNRVNIFDLVSRYVSLKKVGHNFKGLSPFKQEKTPSFFVYPDRGFYYCFSTSQGGDIFDFVERKEGLGFNDAVELIAERFGIDLKYEKASFGDNKPSFKKQILEINEIAADLYSREFFADTQQASEIRNYWTNERKFSLDAARKMRIGFAPTNADELKKILFEKKYDNSAVAGSGLFFSKEGKIERIANLFPRFRGRLMIPICNPQGRVIAFTARKTKFTPNDIAYEEGKYVNSPETEVFKKKSVLFNFDKARSAAEIKKYFIVVEGQLDAIRMYCAGFENTVASQGTAAGIEHFQALARFAKKVVLLFDGDEAGRHAALRVIPICFQAGLEPYVATLPVEDDPDTLILNKGADAMRELIENRKLPAIGFAARSLLAGIPSPTPMEKHDALAGIFQMVASCSSRVLRDDYLREAGNVLGLDLNSVHSDFSKWELKEQRKASVQTSGSDNSQENRKNASQGMLTSAYRDALLIGLHDESIAHALADVLPDEWIQGDEVDARTLRKFLALQREDIGFSLAEIDEYFQNEAEKNLIYSLYTTEAVSSPVKCANQCAEKIYKNHMTREIGILTSSFAAATDPNDRRKILQRISELRRAARIPPAKIVE